MTVIALLTDFGLVDGYAGVMKGVILRIAPSAIIIDLSHDIAPQAIRQGAYVLSQALPYFPPGTVYLAVVDPGVGSTRRALVVSTQAGLFVGPDNGLLDPALSAQDAKVYAADRPEFWLPEVSRTFHGRDVFAPLAAHLVAGQPPQALGSPVTDPVRLVPPAPQGDERGWQGEVMYVDHFGNLVTNIPGAALAGRDWQCSLAGRSIAGLSQTYADAAPGALLGLISSAGTLEIAVRDGSAAQHLGAGAGATVTLVPTGRPA